MADSDAADTGLSRTYDDAFAVTPAYRDRLPDTQNADASAFRGAPVRVDQVGIAGFSFGGTVARPDGLPPLSVELQADGTVPLPAGVRGINMSRIPRCLLAHQANPWTPGGLKTPLEAIAAEVGAPGAQLTLTFRYPIAQPSLRSGLTGDQYLTVRYAGRIDDAGTFRAWLVLDFIYSSACPGSADLADHAAAERGAYAIPHSQRSLANLAVEIDPNGSFFPEDLHRHAVAALKTETQVMVRREDEQAFAELNGANPKFVEDAARLLFAQLDGDARIRDFAVACRHMESLHNHDAVARVRKIAGQPFSGDWLEPWRPAVC
ncbi:MAG: GTP cyclohydrolase FolE2 [Opitutales bacterium]